MLPGQGGPNPNDVASIMRRRLRFRGFSGAELLGCRRAEGSCPIGACPAKVLRAQGSLRLAMVRFIEGVEHAAMGTETLERHRGLAENDEHHALAMEASQLLDRHFGGTPYPISREYFKSSFEPNTRQQPVLIRSQPSGVHVIC